MAELPSFILSWAQLDEIWKYENELASKYLNLPLRQCSAKPGAGGPPPCKEEVFTALKRTARQMWVRASLDLECFKVEKKYEDDSGNAHEIGWGLKVRADGEPVSFPSNRFTIMGWLVKVPSPAECPTGHRYLRSPVDQGLYLGGPASLINMSCKENVVLKTFKSAAEPKCYTMYISSKNQIKPNTELVLNYSWRGATNMFDIEEWQTSECCSEEERPAPAVPEDTEPSRKKMRLPKTIKKDSKEIETETCCTFCGIDLEALQDGDSSSGSGKVDLKRHLALTHCVHICLNSGLNHANPKKEEALTIGEFLTELHKVMERINTLKNHGYQVIPACNYFQKIGYMDAYEITDPQAQDKIFDNFRIESRRAFKMYRAVYLNSTHVPATFMDLLPIDNKTNYKHIAWRDDKRPYSRNFSAASHLSEIEQDAVALEVLAEVKGILEDCKNL